MSDAVTVSACDLVDDAVGPEQSEMARHLVRSDNYSWALTTISSVHPGTAG